MRGRDRRPGREVRTGARAGADRGPGPLIEPGLKDIDPKSPPDKQLSAAVEANVRWSMKQLAQLPEAKKALEEKRFEMVGAVHDLETGKVRLR